MSVHRISYLAKYSGTKKWKFYSIAACFARVQSHNSLNEFVYILPVDDEFFDQPFVEEYIGDLMNFFHLEYDVEILTKEDDLHKQFREKESNKVYMVHVKFQKYMQNRAMFLALSCCLRYLKERTKTLEFYKQTKDTHFPAHWNVFNKILHIHANVIQEHSHGLLERPSDYLPASLEEMLLRLNEDRLHDTVMGGSIRVKEVTKSFNDCQNNAPHNGPVTPDTAEDTPMPFGIGTNYTKD